MHTSLERRPARRAAGNGHRAAGSRRRALIAIPLLIFGALALLAVAGFLVAVVAYAQFSAGLAPASDLEKIQFNAESVITDRTGTVELARFGSERREVVTFDQIPDYVLDATTAVEDKTFWTNTGFDPVGILAAGVDAVRGDARGASTITQQLVRQRLLDPKLVSDPDRKIERKVKEIIQSIRVTEAYPGEDGKKRIISAYLNQNFYGNNSYGVKAAARNYFGVDDLSRLSLAQAAILAGLPQSPSNYDLVRNAVEQDDGSLVVPSDSKIVERRNFILSLMEQGRTPRSGERFSHAEYEAAKREPVVVIQAERQRLRAPHFVWAVRDELAERLCGVGVTTCDVLDRGGLRITTTLDWNLQKLAERWVSAAAVLPKRKDPKAYAASIGVTVRPWMTNLRDKDVNNGALVAMDYQTGEIVAYVGSADYYATRSTKKLQPQFDVLGSGYRQPGSAFKPFNYATGINDRTLTAASMFMDVTTDFGGGYTPTDADGLERGPLRVREALQFSLNIPAVKAVAVSRPEHVFDMATRFGMRFQDSAIPVLSETLGTLEVRPVDMVRAYATLANGGTRVAQTRILSVTAASDTSQPPTNLLTAPVESDERVVSQQAAYITSDILQENTDARKNPIWGIHQITGPDKARRPAALKTGTNNDLKDLNAYGFIAPPDAKGRQAGQYALVVGAWNGNSDASIVSTADKPIFSNDVTAYVWENFVEQATRKWPIHDFVRPSGVVEADVDAFSGMKPGPYTAKTVRELFVDGTAPEREDTTKRGVQVVPAPDGSFVLWHDGCAGTPETRGYLDLDGVEQDHSTWHDANADWIGRAHRGTDVAGGPGGTRTAYFYDGGFRPYGATWGAPFPPTGKCDEAPSPSPSPSESPSPSPSPSASPSASASPSVTPSPSPSQSASPSPSGAPSASPSAPASPSPSSEPTTAPPTGPPATEPPTPEPTAEPTAPPPTPEPTAPPPPPTPRPTAPPPPPPPTPEPTPTPPPPPPTAEPPTPAPPTPPPTAEPTAAPVPTASP